jgi:hypothetical protein
VDSTIYSASYLDTGFQQLKIIIHLVGFALKQEIEELI